MDTFIIWMLMTLPATALWFLIVAVVVVWGLNFIVDLVVDAWDKLERVPRFYLKKWRWMYAFVTTWVINMFILNTLIAGSGERGFADAQERPEIYYVLIPALVALLVLCVFGLRIKRKPRTLGTG